MAHWRKHMDSNYIGSWDIDGEWTGTISAVTGEEVQNAQGKSKKPLISFEEAKKGLVANTTICKTIATMYGSNDTADWVGKKITLYVTTISAFGEDGVECIRVRPQVPK